MSKYATDEEWLTDEEFARVKERVYEHFPNATLDRDGTFTSGILDVAEVLDKLEGRDEESA